MKTILCKWCGTASAKRHKRVFCDNDKCTRDMHANNIGTITTIEMILMFVEQNMQCAYCKRRLPPDIMESDHVVPRKAGGTDNIDNIKVCCASCNRSKGTGTLEDFYKRGLYWIDGPDMTYPQVLAATLFYAHHKRLAHRCRSIIDNAITALSTGEIEAAHKLHRWLDLNGCRPDAR